MSETEKNYNGITDSEIKFMKLLKKQRWISFGIDIFIIIFAIAGFYWKVEFRLSSYQETLLKHEAWIIELKKDQASRVTKDEFIMVKDDITDRLDRIQTDIRLLLQNELNRNNGKK